MSASTVISVDAAQLLEEANGGEPVELTYGYDPDDAEAVTVLRLLEEAAEQQPLLSITAVEDAEQPDLYFQKVTSPKTGVHGRD